MHRKREEKNHSERKKQKGKKKFKVSKVMRDFDEHDKYFKSSDIHIHN